MRFINPKALFSIRVPESRAKRNHRRIASPSLRMYRALRVSQFSTWFASCSTLPIDYSGGVTLLGSAPGPRGSRSATITS